MDYSNLNKISSFMEKNNYFSDFNHVNDLLLNLNYTNLKFNQKPKQKLSDHQYGGEGEQTNIINEQLPMQNQLVQDQLVLNQLVQDQLVQDQLVQDQLVQNQMVQDQLVQEQIVQENNSLKTPQDIYLPNPKYTSDQINTYTIKEGTILYHATVNKKGFNTNYIELGKDKLINFFTPNFRLASDKIEACSIDKQNGYIHVFKVKKDISNIYIKHPYDIADDINSGNLANEFCSQNQNYSGVGFFYPKNNIEMFSNNLTFKEETKQFLPTGIEMGVGMDSQYYSEFGLCNPKLYLEYIYSQKCQTLRKLSDPYRFD